MSTALAPSMFVYSTLVFFGADKEDDHWGVRLTPNGAGTVLVDCVKGTAPIDSERDVKGFGDQEVWGFGNKNTFDEAAEVLGKVAGHMAKESGGVCPVLFPPTSKFFQLLQLIAW